MKDYFDVWFLMNNHEIDKDRLQKAILATFEKRNTPIEDFKYIFSDEFNSDKEKARQWKAFLNRSSIDADSSFEVVVDEMASFLKPIL